MVQTGCPWRAHSMISAHMTQVICPHAAAGHVIFRSYTPNVLHRVLNICGIRYALLTSFLEITFPLMDFATRLLCCLACSCIDISYSLIRLPI